MRHLLLLILLFRVIIPTGMMPDLAGWAAGGPGLVICRGTVPGQGDSSGGDGAAMAAACPFALVVGQAFIAPPPLVALAPATIWQPVRLRLAAAPVLAHAAPLGHRLARGPPAAPTA
ncbi:MULTISPECIES: DUF2946 family protein [unclassified Azospirillum]|uniref:DUF2946 family protein n=1 Tax=unclassified Azospirillum TaxID=2630922 RepID=UPI000B680FBC|nr:MULTISPECIES: DUF2946 family protein [unclassified Azospirillum]SNS13408.1 hypothetical protein SAMN05880556_102129 [Azospirillum sp. RU38E]SNS30519.1 hypothetical protein SAMN05880591_102129 [Azospirillum sp. RU37A]